MYRYGDGSPFPLDENFIDTLTSAVEACTNAFDPLTELDARRERAAETRRDAERDANRLDELEKATTAALAPFLQVDKKQAGAHAVAQKLAASAKHMIAETKRMGDTRVQAMATQAAPKTAADPVIKALRPFFDNHQLPSSAWIMSWDVRGAEPSANAVATAGRISAMFSLAPDPFRAPIRVEQLVEGVTVHMMRKGVFGKAKPAPIDLGKYVTVAFERSTNQRVITLKESASKTSTGLRFAVTDAGATWTAMTFTGDADGDANPLDAEDVAPIKLLVERANAALKDLLASRTLVDLSLGGTSISDLEEPRIVPLEILGQLTPYARLIRERSRMSGELVLKRDVGDGRREELFVPRATLAQQFQRLPPDYQRPFEEMGISAEETQPAITLPGPSPRSTDREDTIVEVKKG